MLTAQMIPYFATVWQVGAVRFRIVYKKRVNDWGWKAQVPTTISAAVNTTNEVAVGILQLLGRTAEGCSSCWDTSGVCSLDPGPFSLTGWGAPCTPARGRNKFRK